MRAALERYFEFSRLGTNWRTEFFAGLTTFVTMAYIVLVNPAILAQAGMPLPAVTAATCLSAAFGCMLMGVIARYPIALAPGMGLNAYFTYTVVLRMHVPWQTALGAVLVSGVAFLMLTALGIRQLILRSIPKELYAAVAGGIGLFIALIGLHNAGIIVSDSTTLIALGDLRSPQTALALAGVILIGTLQVWKVRGALLFGVIGITLAAVPFHLVHWHASSYRLTDITLTAGKLDLRSALHVGLLEIVFVFFFVDLFDNLGTLVAVAKKAGLVEADNSIPRLNSILFADAAATIAGSLVGTSTVTSYVESSAGVSAGGRSGVTAIVTGLCFIAALFAAPFVGIVPTAATAPALIIVGSLMISTLSEISWTEPLSAIPAFLTLIMIPLSASIANGLGFGVIAYACVHILGGKFRRQDWLLYLLAVLFLARFVYVSAA
ncbi:NCS2 family permease [Silvibacterium acidisoli]|uniref:NCS2 family permease n=1 Tax=Acidobacteriaceae bacterium ZG23-2 TaxID=2883246 RepID=UPI00406C11DB